MGAVEPQTGNAMYGTISFHYQSILTNSREATEEEEADVVTKYFTMSPGQEDVDDLLRNLHLKSGKDMARSLEEFDSDRSNPPVGQNEPVPTQEFNRDPPVGQNEPIPTQEFNRDPPVWQNEPIPTQEFNRDRSNPPVGQNEPIPNQAFMGVIDPALLGYQPNNSSSLFPFVHLPFSNS
jgi:hypothetical protein